MIFSFVRRQFLRMHFNWSSAAPLKFNILWSFEPINKEAKIVRCFLSKYLWMSCRLTTCRRMKCLSSCSAFDVREILFSHASGGSSGRHLNLDPHLRLWQQDSGQLDPSQSGLKEKQFSGTKTFYSESKIWPKTLFSLQFLISTFSRTWCSFFRTQYLTFVAVSSTTRPEVP